MALRLKERHPQVVETICSDLFLLPEAKCGAYLFWSLQNLFDPQYSSVVEAISAANSAVKASTAIKGLQPPELTVSDVRDFQVRLVDPLPVRVPVEVPAPVTPMRLAAVPVPLWAPTSLPNKEYALSAGQHASAAALPTPVLPRDVWSPARVPAEVPVHIPAALAGLQPDTVPRSQLPNLSEWSDGTRVYVELTPKSSMAGLLSVCAAQKLMPTSEVHCNLTLKAVSFNSPDTWARFLGSMSWRQFWDVLAYRWPNLQGLELRHFKLPVGAARLLWVRRQLGTGHR